MDIQPKVIFYETVYNKIREINAVLYPEGQRKHSGVIISEFFGISVEFICDDPDAIASIETLNDARIEIVKPGDRKVIMNSGDSEDMLVPDEYLIKVESRYGNFESIYEIDQKKYSINFVKNLRICLEDLLKGLTFQIEKRKSGNYTDSLEQLPPVIFIFDKILERAQLLSYYLESISNNPLTDVIKVHKEQIGSRVSDSKSQRWLLGKGASKNSNLHLPTFVYEKKTSLNINNIENKWLLKILKYLRTALRTLEVNIDEQLKNKTIEYQKIDSQKSKAYNDFSKSSKYVWYNQNDFKKGRQKLQEDYDNYKNRIIEKDKELKILKDKKEKVKKTSMMIVRFMDMEWLNDLDDRATNKITIRLLKDVRYSFLYKLYMELKVLENENSNIDKTVYPRKRNYLLVEYYAVALCIDIFEKLNFQWIKGWKADDLNLLEIDLPSGTIMCFENSTHRIELAYDREIDRSHSIDQDGSYSRFTGEVHRRPDILLSLHNKETETVERALVIEVKYRSFKYLWNKDVETKVMEQCKAYKNIEYYDASTGLTEHKLKKVIVFYPKQSGAKPVESKNGNSIVFIQIEPNEPGNEELAFGYNELSNQIKEFLGMEGVLT